MKWIISIPLAILAKIGGLNWKSLLHWIGGWLLFTALIALIAGINLLMMWSVDLVPLGLVFVSIAFIGWPVWSLLDWVAEKLWRIAQASIRRLPMKNMLVGIALFIMIVAIALLALVARIPADDESVV